MAHDQALEEEHFSGRIDWKLWRRIFVFARPYWRQLATLSAMAALIAVWDVLLPFVTGRLIDHVHAAGRDASLWQYALAYLGIVTTFAACVFGFILMAGRVTTGVSHDIRRTAFARLQELPFSFYDRKAVGWLMARLTSDCNSLSRVLGWALLDLTWGTLVLIFAAVTMFVLNWKLALIVLLIVPPLLIVSRFFQVRLLLTSRALRKANSQTTAAYNEGIVGVRTTKSLVREVRNVEEFGGLAGAMHTHAFRNALYSAIYLPMVLSICGVGVGLALWQGGVLVMDGAITIGTLVMFLQYAAFMAHPVQELANTLTMVQGAQASAERVAGLLETEPDIRDSDELVATMQRLEREGRPPGVAIDGGDEVIHRIEFRNVSFGYVDGPLVLRNFSLTVHAGQTVALVGPTGGGKSTIVALACRFYEPTSGQILLNGVDYRQRSLKWLQANLGMVLQQPHLFGGTIRQNIRYGRLEATDAEVEAAARMVNAAEFIEQLEKGYETPVGEGGSSLSTGQKQLVALARAVIAQPQIFVMDEATSSVDTQTERAIQEAVERVLADRISFVIAHRLSTIRSADLILVIDGGRIVEQGNHHDLLGLRGRYYELYTNQFTHEKEEAVLEEMQK